LFIEFFSFLTGSYFAIYWQHDFLRFDDWLFRLFPIHVRIGELKEVTTANTTGKAMTGCPSGPAVVDSSWRRHTTAWARSHQRGESPRYLKSRWIFDYGIAPDELQAAHHVYRLFTDLPVLEVVKIIFLGFD
jgi:hypothetical protein